MSWAKCAWCEQPMAKGAGCTAKTYKINGADWARVPSADPACHDCNVTEGQLHHPGCDREDCPACGGQAIACDCNDGDEAE